VRREFHHGEAATIHREAVADLQAASANARADGELDGVRRRFDAFDRAGFFDDAGKHGGKVAVGGGVVEPRL
jgi:hypothetical protein